LRIERIEPPPSELLRCRPEVPEILDDDCTPFPIAQHIAAALPIIEAQPIVAEDLVQHPRPMVAVMTPSAFTRTAGGSCPNSILAIELLLCPMVCAQELPA
jgi:hypothetical protein